MAAPQRKSTVERRAANDSLTINAYTEVQNGDGAPEFRYGTKFAIMSTRPDNTRNLRIVLDTVPVPPGKGYKGEAGIALAMLDRLTNRPELRVDGICYDGAFRGTHSNHAMKAGLTVLAPPHSGTAVPTPFTTINCRCGDTHTLWTASGRLHERTILDTGDSLYDRCYGWREDAESLNNTLDRTLYGGRMTAHTATRQHAVMIGFALGRNAIANYIHQRQAQPATV